VGRAGKAEARFNSSRTLVSGLELYTCESQDTKVVYHEEQVMQIIWRLRIWLSRRV
jgi:hypothetical protein